MSIKFGPAGIGGIKEIPKVLESYKEYGIKAAEIPFTYQAWIKSKDVAHKIKYLAEKFDINLSIHAPYWINLNSIDKEKIEKQAKQILDKFAEALKKVDSDRMETKVSLTSHPSFRITFSIY